MIIPCHMLSRLRPKPLLLLLLWTVVEQKLITTIKVGMEWGGFWEVGKKLEGALNARHILCQANAREHLLLLLTLCVFFSAVEQILNGKVWKRIMMTAEKSYNFLPPQQQRAPPNKSAPRHWQQSQGKTQKRKHSPRDVVVVVGDFFAFFLLLASRKTTF